MRSGFLQIPSGDSVNFELGEEGQLFRILDNTSNITLTSEIDANGDVLLVLNDSANGVSASTGSEYPDAMQNAKFTVSDVQAVGSYPETSHTSESGSTVIEVELCGQAATDAQVNFRIDDQSDASAGPVVIPATQA